MKTHYKNAESHYKNAKSHYKKAVFHHQVAGFHHQEEWFNLNIWIIFIHFEVLKNGQTANDNIEIKVWTETKLLWLKKENLQNRKKSSGKTLGHFNINDDISTSIKQCGRTVAKENDYW